MLRRSRAVTMSFLLDAARGRATQSKLIVYATGSGARDVRAGPLGALADAPQEWQAQASNPAFLGFFRWKEWQ